MAEVVLKPGEVLVVRCLGDEPDQYAGPDGEPDGPDQMDLPPPNVGESLDDFAYRLSEGRVGPDDPFWPKGPSGDPVPGSHVWSGDLWVPSDAS